MASGGTAGAIILYEAALGLGIAVGPLLGGALGGISWRAPFFGTAALMAVGLLAILLVLPATPSAPRDKRVRVADIAAAFRSAPLMVLAAGAFLYNYAFFSLLAWSPFPLEKAAAEAGVHFGAHELGYVFFGWGLALAVSSVFVAPRLTGWLGRTRSLQLAWTGLAVDLAVLALLVGNLWGLVVAVVAGGFLLGIVNTVLTEAVMEATDLPRSIASSTYSFVRFLGGAIASWAAGKLAVHEGLGGYSAPYWAGAAAVLGSVVVVTVLGRHIAHVDRH